MKVTQPRQKENEDFLKELDKDRKEKNCEYAVLVSLLETENEFYNNGIVDMAHRFPKNVCDKTTIFYSYNYSFKKCGKKFSKI